MITKFQINGQVHYRWLIDIKKVGIGMKLCYGQ